MAALQALGCGAMPDEPVASESQAVNVCDETVPENRFVDGLPAYAQCDATTGSIWSNNGIDTATSSGGSDWVRTQQGGGYQCTEWAFRYMHFRWDIDYRHGDAREWCDGTLPPTLVKNTLPVHGDLIVFDGGACGADATTGHIAVVDTVDAAKAKVTIVEENRAGRRSTDQSCATCFLHAVANDGSAGGAAGGGGANAAGGGGTTSGAGGMPASAGMPGAGGADGGGRGPLGGAGGTSGTGGASAPDDGGAQAAGSGRGGGSTAGGSSAGGTPPVGAAGQPSTAVGGAGPSGTGGSAVSGGSGGNAAAAGQAAANTAGRDPAGHEDLLPAETNDGGGCALRPARGESGLGIFVALLGFVASRRRGRSRARAA